MKHLVRQEQIKQFGNHSLACTVLQPGMCYFELKDVGFIAYRKFAGDVFVLGNPISSENNLEVILRAFIQVFPKSSFVHISKNVVEILHHKLGYYGTLCGHEPVVIVAQWNLHGKKKNVIRTARNHAQKNEIRITEQNSGNVNLNILENFSQSWLKTRRLRKKEIQFLIRPLEMGFALPFERLFCAYQNEQLVGFILFDPIFSHGKVIGYCPNISRSCLKFKAGIWYVIMSFALEKFKSEGIEKVALGIVPILKDYPCEVHESYLLRKAIENLYHFGNSFYIHPTLDYEKKHGYEQGNAEYV